MTSLFTNPDSVILVGNGPSLMHRQMGAQIDGFAEVVRFNHYQINGFEAHVGTRTTLWCTVGGGMLPGDAAERPQNIIQGIEGRLPAYQPAQFHEIPSSFYAALRKEIQEATSNSEAVKILPSGGYLLTRYLLDTGICDYLTLAGFDHFSRRQDQRHHYWNTSRFTEPKEHDGGYEQETLQQYIQQSRLAYL